MVEQGDPRTACTFLFVPGDRPERFDKAVTSGADLVILDLEDAVGEDRKVTARSHVTRWLSEGGSGCVRINGAGSAWYDDDVEALRLALGLRAVVLPMAEDPQAASDLHAQLKVPVVALIETAAGLIHATDIARADGVCRLALGALDLAADLGTEHPEVLNYARIQLVIASSAAGLSAPIDSPDPDVAAPATAGSAAVAAKTRGMGGKLCIHPNQVGQVGAAFAVSPAEVQWAQRVLKSATAGVSVVDGMMVDAPVLKRAKAVLERAATAGAVDHANALDAGELPHAAAPPDPQEEASRDSDLP